MKTLKVNIPLPNDIIEFHRIFISNGHKLYLVGGSVRDFIKGKEPHDFDVVTDATPDIIKKILHGYNTDLQGEHFGIIRVFTNDEPNGHEIATFRVDISNGRDNKSDSEKVRFGEGVTIYDDCMRRDLTQNALFYDIETSEIIDIVGGIDDIKNHIIRAVGVPRQRFDEDRLRIIRTIRFCATDKDAIIDSTTSQAIIDDNRLFFTPDDNRLFFTPDEFIIEGIFPVTRERIYAEMVKVEEKACADSDYTYLPKFFKLLSEYGLFEMVFNGLVYSEVLPCISLTVALTQALRNNADKTINKILPECKIPTKTIKHILLLHKISNGITSDNAYELYVKVKALNLCSLYITEYMTMLDKYDNSVKTFLLYEPNTDGNTVINDGFKGVEIGNEIRRREKQNFLSIYKSVEQL